MTLEKQINNLLIFLTKIRKITLVGKFINLSDFFEELARILSSNLFHVNNKRGKYSIIDLTMVGKTSLFKTLLLLSKKKIF